MSVCTCLVRKIQVCEFLRKAEQSLTGGEECWRGVWVLHTLCQSTQGLAIVVLVLHSLYAKWRPFCAFEKYTNYNIDSLICGIIGGNSVRVIEVNDCLATVGMPLC